MRRLHAILLIGSGAVPALTGGCASTAPAGPERTSASAVEVAPGVRVDRALREVRVDAHVACDRGWLEQAVCRAGTRDHESLLAIDAAPSSVHAGLLLLGLEPGVPGSWREAPGTPGGVERSAPKGPSVELWVRTAAGEVPLSSWIHDPVHGHAFAPHPWVFAGSRVRANTRSMGPGEHYVADRTGSVAGIVTFGDEVIAFSEVLPDRADVAAPEWQARTEAMPASGTAVQLVVRVPKGGSA